MKSKHQENQDLLALKKQLADIHGPTKFKAAMKKARKERNKLDKRQIRRQQK